MRYYNKNAEGYADPTAGAAIANIRRVERIERRKALHRQKLQIRKEQKKRPVKAEKKEV